MKKEIYIGLFAIASLMMLPVGLVAQGEQDLAKAELEKIYEEGTFGEGRAPKNFTVMPFICFAAYKGNLQVVDELLKGGLDVNTASSDGRTVLMYAIDAEHGSNMDVIRLILNQPKVNLNAQDSYGQTPLILAVIIPNLEAVKALVEAGAKMDLESNHGTALSSAQMQAESFTNEDKVKQFKEVVAYLQQAQKAQPVMHAEVK